MSEDRVVKFLKELSGKLYELSKALDELSRGIENFVEVYQDAYGEDYDYNYLCQDCGHEFEEYGPCPRCGSTDVIHIAKEDEE